MARPLPLVLAQVPSEPTGGLPGFAADVERRLRPHWPARPLVVYPELHLCGARQPASGEAEPIDGPRDRVLSELAGDLGIWLVPGSVYEQGKDGRVYNAAPVYSPDGKRTAAYRKVFPWRPYEATAPGSEFVVFEIPGTGRVGVSICYDAWFPEVTRQLAWMGAELVLNLVLTPTGDRAQEVILCRANAIVNQVFVASVNAASPTGVGRSLLADPQGVIRAQAAGAEEVTLTEVIDLDDVTNVRAYGTAALNRMWSHFRPGDSPIELPLYQGRIDPATWAGLAGPDLPLLRRSSVQEVVPGSRGYGYLSHSSGVRALRLHRQLRGRRHQPDPGPGVHHRRRRQTGVQRRLGAVPRCELA